jgi:hypothetical protein
MRDVNVELKVMFQNGQSQFMLDTPSSEEYQLKISENVEGEKPRMSSTSAANAKMPNPTAKEQAFVDLNMYLPLCYAMYGAHPQRFCSSRLRIPHSTLLYPAHHPIPSLTQRISRESSIPNPRDHDSRAP